VCSWLSAPASCGAFGHRLPPTTTAAAAAPAAAPAAAVAAAAPSSTGLGCLQRRRAPVCSRHSAFAFSWTVVMEPLFFLCAHPLILGGLRFFLFSSFVPVFGRLVASKAAISGRPCFCLRDSVWFGRFGVLVCTDPGATAPQTPLSPLASIWAFSVCASRLMCFVSRSEEPPVFGG
jgi:hypothetical protein